LRHGGGPDFVARGGDGTFAGAGRLLVDGVRACLERDVRYSRQPDLPESAELSRDATGEGIMLGPGALFLVEPRPTGWLRFNVAFCADERMWRFLEQRIALGSP
ncbi:MAG: hypothetical protein ACK59X_27030, partial [Acidovorax sp.]